MSYKQRIQELFDRGMDAWDIYDQMDGLVSHNEIEIIISEHDEFGPLDDFDDYDFDDDEGAFASAGWGMDESYE